MQIDKHLIALAQSGLQTRRNALEMVLQQEGLPYTCQTEEPSSQRASRQIQNYLLFSGTNGSVCPLFCAHYDAHGSSSGANDNAAALCILIELAKTFRAKRIPAAFCFLDAEEEKHLGARLFENRQEQEFSVIINLDMCGYGDTIALYAKGGAHKPAAAVFFDKNRMKIHNVRQVRYIPEGDECCFQSRRQPVLSMAVMPAWDINYLDAIAFHGSGMLGRPPEIEMMLGEMEVSSTMHGGWRDKVEWVQPDAMKQVYDFLLDAVCAPPPAKRFGLF